MSVNLNAPSYLPTLFGSRSTGNSLLASLHGFGNPAPAADNPIAALEQAKTGEAQQVARLAADPRVKRDLARFTQALTAAETPAQLLANPIALRVLLTANGLGDQTGDTALATRALLSNPERSDAPVNRLADPRWLSVIAIYAFATKGLSVLHNPAAIAVLAHGYAEALWRTNLDQTTPGLANALDFQQRASTITNVDQVLGDPTFRAVLTTALGIPEQIASQTPTAREQAISTRIDLTKFKDPTFVAQLTERYLIAARRAASQISATAAPDRATQAVRPEALAV
jgi:hypothetical protein